MKSILFVCLGNICRSATAEGIFQTLVDQAGRSREYDIDSAGTAGYHVGQKADHRMRTVARQRGYNLESIARQLNTADFDRFDLIITMDDANYYDVNALNPGSTAEVVRMSVYCETHDITEVPDPYYGGEAGFHEVIDILEDACANLLQQS